MGTWGVAIFSDDVAADVRDCFTDLIADGLNSQDATERLVAESKEILDDEDDALVFWLALAATQSKLGRLTNEVRDRALAVIDSGDELRRWAELSKSDISRRKQHLLKLRQQLCGVQPKPKKLRPRQKSSTDFKPGDVVAYRVDDGLAVRFCVLQLWGDRGGIYTNICLLGLDEGKPFRKQALSLADTLGPHFTMLMHEPEEGIRILRRGVRLPPQDTTTFRAWNRLPVDGHACLWKDFPDALRQIIPRLAWRP